MWVHTVQIAVGTAATVIGIPGKYGEREMVPPCKESLLLPLLNKVVSADPKEKRRKPQKLKDTLYYILNS